jgi:alanine dehydrogenase
MDIGIPRERKPREGRVALTPDACTELVQLGHQVWVERDAGRKSGYQDQDYVRSGCSIALNNNDLYDKSKVIVKVKEPIDHDLERLTSHHVLFCYLHLAAAPALLTTLLERGLTAYAFETLAVDGRLPLLAPMSAVAGRLAVQLGCHYLEQTHGGAGILLGGVAGTQPGNVLVLGAGVAGGNAAALALAMGAQVQVCDRSDEALAALRRKLPGITTFKATPNAIEDALSHADLVVGAVLLPGAAAPRVISKAMLQKLKPERVVVDVAIDQGGCIEGIRATDWNAPAYVEAGHTFVAVTNLPGAVPRTATQALSRAILPWVEALAGDRPEANPALHTALAVRAGQIIAPALKTLRAS